MSFADSKSAISSSSSNMKIDVQNSDVIEETLTANGLRDDKILRMMVRMGYKSGTGLGKSEQGIVEPVNIKIQLDKRGLGLCSANGSYSNTEWDMSLEKLYVKEEVHWLENSEFDNLTYDTLITWIVKGKPLLHIDDETNFMDSELLQDILRAKDIFDEFDLPELCKARARANPFETVRYVFFMNRAALKMANIDAATNFMFTSVDQNVRHRQTNGPYYFADVCAGPGGFSEYILWRKKWLFKGFGFTLKGEHDFKLHESSCMSGVTFQPYYGASCDGNVCNPANIRDFAEKVLQQTDGLGVHFMMSDGGFSVEGNENLQEVLSKQLYTCQCLVALEIVRSGGYFVTKLFDIFTLFSVGLVFLMYQCFDKVAVFKPNSSRPANSERYLICSGLKTLPRVLEIRQYLREIVKNLWDIREKHQDSDVDITEIVPMHILKEDREFFKYIVNSNEKLGYKQKIGLLKLAAFCRNPLLTEPRQEMLRSQCLSYWRIPDRSRIPQPKLTVDDLLASAVHKPEFILVQPREVSDVEGLRRAILDFNEWHFVPLMSSKNCGTCNFYAAISDLKVCKLQKSKWVRVKNVRLCRGTLLYGELVQERCISKHDGAERELKSLHVIDALRLGDTSLADLPFVERLDCIQTYCRAINFEAVPNIVRIRPKVIQSLESLSMNSSISYDSDVQRYFTSVPVYGSNMVKEFYHVNSMLLLKTDENQSFNSTYVLRVQVFISGVFQSDSQVCNSVTLDDVKNCVKSKC